jgi:hypothetical protein
MVNNNNNNERSIPYGHQQPHQQQATPASDVRIPDITTDRIPLKNKSSAFYHNSPSSEPYYDEPLRRTSILFDEKPHMKRNEPLGLSPIYPPPRLSSSSKSSPTDSSSAADTLMNLSQKRRFMDDDDNRLVKRSIPYHPSDTKRITPPKEGIPIIS